ncbi:uncharacterized protein EV420DRAFT_1752118 [Desarmillaria tabescens]|uniref:Uncharacterized protein n=1 Tax=Armillaria tabescens TaxID=1929756 RepID=A0AA39MR15_ARMTA|nr:uncharacterized protein EV420DRAFT_1752118 [Desarmillaria tabescens]KAK0443073.1 hypothetical protein EV420DRAFT_1752118 [Desarmillaria tabescens]
MSAPETATKFSSAETSSVAGGQLVGRSNKGAVAPKEALKLRLDLNLEVEIAIQAKVNGDITLSLLVMVLTVLFSYLVVFNAWYIRNIRVFKVYTARYILTPK